MNEIININEQDAQYPVDGRELHERLQVGTPYKDWFPRMVEYGFEEDKDFVTERKNVLRADGATMPQMQTDHRLTLSMAKEICMIQRTERGRDVRRYLIAVENQWNSPEAVMSRALQMAERKMEQLRRGISLMEAQKAADAPKVLFAESVETSSQSILIGDLAKILRQNGVDVGQNRLFETLRREGYLIKYGESRNMPTQYAMENGWMEIKERTINNPDGSIRLTRTTKVTGKGQVFFINKYRRRENTEWGGPA